MKFRLIEDQRERFPVRVVCDVMGVCQWRRQNVPNGGEILYQSG